MKDLVDLFPLTLCELFDLDNTLVPTPAPFPPFYSYYCPAADLIFDVDKSNYFYYPLNIALVVE